MHSERAIATRCCWPPDSWPGYLLACSGILTRLRKCMALSSACFLGILRTQIGASVQFSRIVRCGNRLKCWNTMPTSRRTSSIFLRSLVSSLSSTTILPFWCSSSRLMQRIIVDLPEPDGPQMTMRSPRMTLRLMSFSTWNSPYHLCMRDDLDGDIGVGDVHLLDIDLDLFGADCVFNNHGRFPVFIVCGRCRAGVPCTSNSATCRSRTARRRSRRRPGR